MSNMHVDKFYTAMKHMQDVYDKNGRKLAFDCKDMPEYDAWKKKTRAKLAEITGIDKMTRCDLVPQIVSREKMDGYERVKIIIQCEPDVFMPLYMLKPDGISHGERRPVALCLHGHCSAGKDSPAGRIDIPAVAEAVSEYNYAYGAECAKRGYIAFCPDARAFGERREDCMQGDDAGSYMNSTCTRLNHMAICLGQSLTGMWTWDLMRLIDYIETLEECDSGRIVSMGLSGGGLQTLWLCAMDDRPVCAVVSGYFYGYKDALLGMSHCACNYVPHLWENVDMGDLGALIAPRPLLVETGDSDPLNGSRGMSNVTEQVDITREAYRLFSAEKSLIHHVFEGGHYWNAEKTYDFVADSLRC